MKKEVNLEECSICKGLVPHGPGYYNGMVVNGKLVCEGCMLASGLCRGCGDNEAEQLIASYCADKHIDMTERSGR